RFRNADGIPSGLRRFAREPVTRQRWNHEMKGIRLATAMGGWIGQRLDDLHLLDDRAGPTMRDDHRQRIFMLRTSVNEMDVEAIDLCDEVRHGFQFCLALTPVIIRPPIACELLHRRELYALRCVRDLFWIWPSGRIDALSEIGKRSIRKVELKRTNGSFVCLWLCSASLRHEVLLLSNSSFRFCKCFDDGAWRKRDCQTED